MVNKLPPLGLQHGASNYSFTSAVPSAFLIPTFHITFFGCESARAWTLDFCDARLEPVWLLYWTAGASSFTRHNL